MLLFLSSMTKRIKWSILIMRTKCKFNIFLSQFLRSFSNERNIWVFRILFNFWVEKFLDIPLTTSVVVTILFSISSKNVAEIPTFMVRIQVVFFNEFLNSFTPHKVIWIIKVNLLNSNTVTSCCITIIGNTLSNPVVSRDNFHIPYFIFVTKQN